jgi:hypothetical protein
MLHLPRGSTNGWRGQTATHGGGRQQPLCSLGIAGVEAMEQLLIAPQRELAPGELILHPLRIRGGATSTLTIGERQAVLRLVRDHQGMMLIGRCGRR